MHFEQAHRKLARADQHAADLKRQVEMIVDRANQSSWIESDEQTGNQIIHYRINNFDLLPQVALILGDAVHNIKTALDYAWVETLGMLIPTARDNRTKFPVFDSLGQLKAGLRGRGIDKTQPGLFDLVVDRIKPYEDGDATIWVIHCLDIQDKHRLLIPTMNYGNVVGLKLKDERGGVHRVGSWGMVIDNDTVRLAVDRNARIEDKGSLPLEILLKEGPFGSLEVGEALRIFAIRSLEILHLLENFLGI